MVKRPPLPTLRAIAARLDGHLPPAGARIGLLGGSFNPAHDAHRQISEVALKRLALDEVWWLVSPQNPLKSSASMAPLEARLTTAAAHAHHPRIRATDIETLLATRFTADTLTALKARFPRVTFVWLMGADNLRQFHRWQSWQKIFHDTAVAVFDRPPYALGALAGKTARKFKNSRIRERSARRLGSVGVPSWVFLHIRRNPLSATAIRRKYRKVGAHESQDGSVIG